MAFKDYYRILGVPPEAPHADIKRKFRTLALQYHPDRNVDNEFAVIRFREIQEAYNVLSNQTLRISYDREWRLQFPGASVNRVKEVSTASVLKEADALISYIRQADLYRFNKDYVFTRIREILSEENMAVLLHTADRKTNTQITERLMEAATKLSWKSVTSLIPALQKLSDYSDLPANRFPDWKKKLRLNDYWERYYPWAALLIAVLICFAIYRLSTRS